MVEHLAQRPRGNFRARAILWALTIAMFLPLVY
jgi:hypothetical protein